jgi:hypothetical protein
MRRAGSPVRRLGLTAFLALLSLGLASPATAQQEADQPPPPVPVADDDLTAALETGEVSEAEYALERARSIFQLARVRREFGDVERPGPRDATLILRDLALRTQELTGAERALAEAILARPTDGVVPGWTHGYSTNATSFACGPGMCFHWVTTTSDRSTPEWAATVQDTWEHVWSVEIGDLEYRPPRFDGTSQTDGPMSNADKRKLDVYILDLGRDGVFGYCAALSGGLTPPVYCAVDNDYAPLQFGTSQSPEGFLQVTAAHEFHHSSQAAYDFQEDWWLLEGTATNMEETVYPAIDDNVNFLFDWSPLSRPASPLDRGGFGNSEYGSWIFWRYLQEKVGGDPTILRDIWDRADAFGPSAPDDYSLEAVRHELGQRGQKFADTFASFATANRRRDYVDAQDAGYPTPPLTKTFTVGRQTPDTGWRSWRINHLAARIVAFKPGRRVAAGARLRVIAELPGSSTTATLVVVRTDGSTTTRRLARTGSGLARTGASFSRGQVRRLEVVLANGSTRMGQCWSFPGPPSYSCQGRPLDDRRLFELRGKLIP